MLKTKVKFKFQSFSKIFMRLIETKKKSKFDFQLGANSQEHLDPNIISSFQRLQSYLEGTIKSTTKGAKKFIIYSLFMPFFQERSRCKIVALVVCELDPFSIQLRSEFLGDWSEFGRENSSPLRITLTGGLKSRQEFIRLKFKRVKFRTIIVKR